MTIQTLTIDGWVPEAIANGSHGHWAVKAKKLKAAQIMVWSAAKQARWEPLTGRARLTILFTFGVNRGRDTDNLYSRAKGAVDGLVKGGWIKDDNADVLELIVKSETVKGTKRTRMLLEPLQ